MKRLHCRWSEAGVTMVEIVVAVAVLGIISIVMFDFLDRAGRITHRTDRHGQAEHEAQLAMRVVSQNIRGANPIGGACQAGVTDTIATPPLPNGYDNCLAFTVSRNQAGASSCARSQFVYAIVGSGTQKTLVENRQDFTGTTSCTAGPLRSRRVLLEKVVNTASQPAFTYYRDDGSAINTSTQQSEIPRATSIRLTLRTSFATSADPLFFTTVAAPRNIR